MGKFITGEDLELGIVGKKAKSRVKMSKVEFDDVTRSILQEFVQGRF